MEPSNLDEHSVGKRRRTYSADFKAKVVLEWLEGKQSLSELANQHNLHQNQIKNWKCILRRRLSSLFKDRRISRTSRPGIPDESAMDHPLPNGSHLKSPESASAFKPLY